MIEVEVYRNLLDRLYPTMPILPKRFGYIWRPFSTLTARNRVFYQWRSIFHFSRKTEKRYRPNSFCIVKRRFSIRLCDITYVRWRHCNTWSILIPKCIDRIWQCRHRTWLEAEKIWMQHKYLIFTMQKELGRYLLSVFLEKWKLDRYL